MLTDALKHIIQSNYSLLLKRKQLQTRPGQKQMIAEIAKTLATVAQDAEGLRSAEEPGICVVEAGTGTGKTLAYLVAALPVAKALDKKLIVSTATVALQEQVLHKDIPDLLKNSELQFSYVLAKGRGRYVCLAKLDNALRANSSSAALRDLFNVNVEAASDLDRALYESFLDKLGKGDWQGDRDDWPEVIDDLQWRSVAVEAGQCSGNRCAYFSNCCYFRARDGLDKADCIVANHDLVLSDLALGGGVILPDPANSIYIFDEAHQLPTKSIAHFAHELRLAAMGTWLEQFAQLLGRLQQELVAPNRCATLMADVATQAQQLRGSLNEKFVFVQQYSQRAESASTDGNSLQYVFVRGVVDFELREVIDALAVEFGDIATRASKITDLLKAALDEEAGEVERSLAEQWFPLFGAAQLRLEAAASCCVHFAKADVEGAVPEARWLNFKEKGDQLEITVSASPVLAASALQAHLWDHCFAAVLTSATLSTLGDFEFLRKRCGLPDSSNYHKILSPFSHQSAGVLQVPRQGFDASNSQGHTQAIINVLPKLIANEQGVLVLFSSRRQLLEVLAGVQPELRNLVLAQDDYSKQELLRIHKLAVDAGNTSVIFGLASMAEGIDLPGAYCTHVVIAKIPFPVPNDPVDATLGEWVKAQGGNPFQEISVPEACLRLIQASGRLLRQESDRGTITILDERLSTRSYGRAILASLPPYQRQTL